MKISSVKTLSIFTLTAFFTAGCGVSDSEEAENTSTEEETKEPGNPGQEHENGEKEEKLSKSEQGHNHNDEHGHNDENDHHDENNYDEEHDHEHNHEHDEETEEIYNGYFEDEQVEGRPLSDWNGDWQSVYPYHQDGTLDEVYEHKAAKDEEMTVEEYKEYYEVGYETDVERIVIEDDTFTFYEGEEKHSSEYTYDGYKILTYEAGNRGVRFIFERAEEEDSMPEYIQFSDHKIYPSESDHFHLYWGDDREALLEDVTNWATYYPSDLDGEEIKKEMTAH
ncbi:metal-binding protein ZinT [Alkalicoccus halolimnae]|uniref:Metal-binding protein ZinT n=1 Tax=Alkalicoccus halolimnae TaxID=1667239 RepID=A0A5C7FFT2_9BACI|nr:metal-binding protein ZinT [Alkalicoccus halolimnae]TXF83299.1 metal-binding protein ZinT [Alkalicoccus halolimnae]